MTNLPTTDLTRRHDGVRDPQGWGLFGQSIRSVAIWEQMKHPVVKEDHYSKRALRNKMASTIARELEYNFMPLFIVVPKLVLLDNTAEFQNFSIKTLLENIRLQSRQ